MSLRLLALFPCFLFTFLHAQEPPREPIPRPPGAPPRGPAGHARAGRPGPWENDILVYRVAADGTSERVAVFERAGVATLARMADGQLIAAHQHFPADFGADFDKVALRFSKDEGRTWTPPEVLRLAGLPEGMRFPFDPTLVPLPDGRVRLYFTSVKGRRLEEHRPAIYSAISRDGVNYEFEPGQRFGIEGRLVIDCAVVLHDGVFHLYSPDNGPSGVHPDAQRPVDGVGYHATSANGLTFTRQADVRVEGRRRWLGNAQSDGKVITFYGTGAGVWTATSTDGAEWQLDRALKVHAADPGAVPARDGGIVLIGTGRTRDR